MSKGNKSYSQEEKLEAVRLFLDEGLTKPQVMEELGITQSMSGKVTCLDKACMEGFFGHMKDEFYRGRRFDSFEAFKLELAAYIAYWNNHRYQIGLKGMTPV